MAGERLAATHESTPVLARLAERFRHIDRRRAAGPHARAALRRDAGRPAAFRARSRSASREPARAIVSLARAVHDGTLSLEPMAPLDMTLDALRALPGFDEHGVVRRDARDGLTECVPGRRCVAGARTERAACAIIRAACGAGRRGARMPHCTCGAFMEMCRDDSPHLIPAPLGDIAVRIEDDALTGLYFVGQKYFPPVAIVTDADAAAMSPLARKVAEEVAEYFTGMRETFSVPIHLRGTAFQRRVWKELLAIPFGELVTYGDITERVRLPMARAPWAVRSAGTRCRSWCRAIAWSAHRAASPAMRAASIASARCCRSKARGCAAPTIRCNRRSRSERKRATASCVQHGPARFTFRIRAGRHVISPGTAR